MHGSPRGSSNYGISGKILELAAISFSRDHQDAGIKLVPPELAGGFFSAVSFGKLGIQIRN